MLRLVLLLLYLFASSSTPQENQGGSLDPLGGNSTPPSTNTDQGGSLDPLG